MNGTRLRVAVDVTALLDVHPTGIAVFTAEVLHRLGARHDLDVSAFALSWRGRDRLDGVLPPGVTPHRRPAAARPLRAAWKRTDHPAIEWWSGPADVVFGPNFVVPPTRRAAAVVTVHDLTCLHYPELCTPATLAYPALIRRAVRRGAWIHAVSPFVADEVRTAFAVDPDRVVAIGHGAPAPPPGGPADPALGAQLAGGTRYVLAVGTIEPRKDLPLLVRAWDAVAAEDPEVRLVVAGPDGWGVDAFTAAVAGARHRDRIVRLGWVDDDQRAALLAGAAVFAFASVYEGFGLPPLEAMAAGAPVVTTAAGAVPDTVGNAALVVPPGDAEALADGLRRVLTDPEVAADLRRRGLANLDRFSWERTTDALVALYGRAATGSSA